MIWCFDYLFRLQKYNRFFVPASEWDILHLFVTSDKINSSPTRYYSVFLIRYAYR